MNETHLYVECPQCHGSGPTHQHDCSCRQGYVETGFTQERFDRLVKDGDRMLMLLDDLCKSTTDEDVKTMAWRFLKGHEDDLVNARSRTKL